MQIISSHKKHSIWPLERTQSSGWLYDVDHEVLAKISARLDIITGLNVAKTDPVSIENHPYSTFESEAYQANWQNQYLILSANNCNVFRLGFMDLVDCIIHMLMHLKDLM